MNSTKFVSNNLFSKAKYELKTCVSSVQIQYLSKLRFIAKAEICCIITITNRKNCIIYCQAQRSWLALISVYYRPPTANRPPTATRNSSKMANLAYIEGRMDLNIPLLTSLNQLQLALACLSLAQLCPSLFQCFNVVMAAAAGKKMIDLSSE